MTREDILINRLEMASHNLYCYSENYLMDTPKAGHEEEHKAAAAEVEILKVWLKEFHRTNSNSTREFIGHISGWGRSKTYDGCPLANWLSFEVETGAPYLYGDQRKFNIGPEVQGWFVGENGSCGKYDMEKHERSSRRVKITVDKIEYVRSIEWIADE